MENKYKIIIYSLLGLIILYIVYLFINYSENFSSDIYSHFTNSLNDINKKVRKGVFTYFNPDKKIVKWVINKIQSYNRNGPKTG